MASISYLTDLRKHLLYRTLQKLHRNHFHFFFNFVNKYMLLRLVTLNVNVNVLLYKDSY